MPPAGLDEVCRTSRTRDQPQDIHRPSNGFLHVAILVDGLPRLGGEAVRRAMEEGRASSPTQHPGSSRFGWRCYTPRRVGETSPVPAKEFCMALGRRRALVR